MTDEIARLDATALAGLIRSGELHPRELLDDTIARIERLDPAVNAVIHRRFDAARAEIDAVLPDGPFRGVPITLKDLWPTSAGDPFHQGVRALAEIGHTHPVDSDLVRRYRAAGFVIVGRTSTAELGLAATTEPLAYGPTRNPWNLDFGVGGSSGGAAASVAAGMTSVANASDGGGSIRIPAALCGLVGLKPSRGRVPMGPEQDEWGSSVQHIVSHTMRDCAAVLDATAVNSPSDGVMAPRPHQPFVACVGEAPGPLRIGVCTDTRPNVELHPECLEVVGRAAASLGDLGHRVEHHYPAPLVEPPTGSLGVLSTVSTRARLDQIADIVGRPLTADDVEPGTWEMAQRADSVSGVAVIEAQADQHRYRRAMSAWWESGWDLLLTPTTAQPAPRIGELAASADAPFDAQLKSIPFAMYTSPFNITGQPALSVPAGFSADGVPLGAQLVAAYGREDLLLTVGAQLEHAWRWADTRAPLHP